jgi:hypothetical protein
MNRYFISLVLATASTVAMGPAFADDAARQQAKQVMKLKDGGTLYVFENGTMAKEDKNGRAATLKDGQILETESGEKITATSSEAGRLGDLLQRGHQN